MTARLEASWTVPADHPVFAGHFPGRPIVPGVLLLDWLLARIVAAQGSAPAPWAIVNAKFLSPVAPGETLSFAWQARPSGAIEFTIASAGRPVAAGLLAAPAQS